MDTPLHETCESYDMFACSGILFHLIIRGIEFVTRKVTNRVALSFIKIKILFRKFRFKRDWGFAEILYNVDDVTSRDSRIMFVQQEKHIV